MINYIIYAVVAILIGTNLYFRSRIFKLSRKLNDKGIHIPISMAFNDEKLKAELSRMNPEDGITATELMKNMRLSFLILGGIILCLLLLYFMR
jgi:hypothetical protein